VPRHARAAEGDGYLLGVVNRWDEGRNDLLVLDALHVDEGPLAIVRMPTLDAARPLDPRLVEASPMRPFNCWTRFDHATRRATTYFAGPDSSVQECCFVPRHARAAEGDGYLLGVVNRWDEGRNDLLVLDALHLDEGPLAIVRMPTRIHPQVHGCWVPADERNAV